MRLRALCGKFCNWTREEYRWTDDQKQCRYIIENIGGRAHALTLSTGDNTLLGRFYWTPLHRLKEGWSSASSFGQYL